MTEQPLHVVTEAGLAAVPAVATLFATIASAGFAYRWALLRAIPLRLPAILLCAGAGIAVASLSPVLFSSDIYAYAAYGEMARIGLNPYAHVLPGASDTIVRAAQWQWGGAFPICIYGAAFVAFARGIVTALGSFGLGVQLAGFRAASCAALLACTALAYWAYDGDRAMRLRAAITIGLNPVAIWCATEGHNDALALAIVLAGFALIRARFAALGATLTALSALVKAPGLIAAAGLAAINPRARIGAALGIGIVGAGSIPLLGAIAGDLAPHGRYAPQASLQAVLAPLGPPAALALAAVAALSLAVVGSLQLRQARNPGWIWLGLGGWVLIPNPYPWYALWLLALAGLAPRSRAGGVAIAVSFASLLRYLPDAIGTPTEALSVLLGVTAVLPLLALIPLRPRREYNERFV